ncbi:SSU ribosomal protein S8p (S15Ae) [Mycoplasmopsis meleagridis]|uniref:Small ribosomal subunit protein uS8 n=1 Tax=Mycoplasmopsis meleagridis ATCC 25294 TaxID=1264554 RepID=A0A0F5H1A2_9BACT|nr:30S ribosomal protein S8 [Mycoplasmopsis meleagridis]KKB27059.1 SSU ribosomal protein S8p (S15Ae) [Mycoplasmopsis meleagridis ATCC 25294]KUH47229.1 30S ribosomal protein S8 [Mycoplasmopsis meleagridis]OAD18452.1 SSU ribosomal protein S8p (S15Ae) [Mycoplasmopsis meleagridis]VEU77364.1 30S ribosomal protein S8 [Mycoplasmopsis meleagridis]
MFITDPISDMIVRIKNANQRKFKTVNIPFSLKKAKILDILVKEGYITSYNVKGEGKNKEFEVSLKYKNGQKAIIDFKRISKPGLRVYASVEKLPHVLSGYGIAIISTSKGIMTDKEARKENVGGEVIAYIW